MKPTRGTTERRGPWRRGDPEGEAPKPRPWDDDRTPRRWRNPKRPPAPSRDPRGGGGKR